MISGSLSAMSRSIPWSATGCGVFGGARPAKKEQFTFTVKSGSLRAPTRQDRWDACERRQRPREGGSMANERGETQQTARAAAPSPAGRGATVPGTPQTIKWDDSNLKSSYANVCNVSSTREEVVLVFGINQAWERGQAEMQVQLTDRIILSPFAAKRLAGLLTNVVREYESRFGTLNVEPRRSEETSPSAS